MTDIKKYLQIVNENANLPEAVSVNETQLNEVAFLGLPFVGAGAEALGLAGLRALLTRGATQAATTAARGAAGRTAGSTAAKRIGRGLAADAAIDAMLSGDDEEVPTDSSSSTPKPKSKSKVPPPPAPTSSTPASSPDDDSDIEPLEPASTGSKKLVKKPIKKLKIKKLKKMPTSTPTTSAPPPAPSTTTSKFTSAVPIREWGAAHIKKDRNCDSAKQLNLPFTGTENTKVVYYIYDEKDKKIVVDGLCDTESAREARNKISKNEDFLSIKTRMVPMESKKKANESIEAATSKKWLVQIDLDNGERKKIVTTANSSDEAEEKTIKWARAKFNTVVNFAFATPKVDESCSKINENNLSTNDLAEILLKRLTAKYPDIERKFDTSTINDAVISVAEFHAGVDELGTSDIGAMLREIVGKLKEKPVQTESITTEAANGILRLNKDNQVIANSPREVEFAKLYVKGNRGDYRSGGPSALDEKYAERFVAAWDVKRIRSGFAGSGTDVYTNRETGEKFEVDKQASGRGFYGTTHYVREINDVIDETWYDPRTWFGNDKKDPKTTPATPPATPQTPVGGQTGGVIRSMKDRKAAYDAAVNDGVPPPPKNEGQGVTEAKGLKKRVRVVKGPYAGELGWIREVIHGAFKGAPKRFNVDLDNGEQANNMAANELRLVKEQGVTEGSFGSGYGSVFTLHVNTGEESSKTKTKKFKREDDAVLWAEDYADQHEMFPNLTMEIQDENGNVVWELEEAQGVTEDTSEGAITFNGYTYRKYVEKEDFDEYGANNSKIYHTAISPSGEEISMDFTPYVEMDADTFRKWIELGMPERQGIGSLDKEQIDDMYNGSEVNEDLFPGFRRNKLPTRPKTVRIGKFTVEITPDDGFNYIGFAWTDSAGKTHYEEIRIGDRLSYDREFSVADNEQLLNQIKQEIDYAEEQIAAKGGDSVDRLKHLSGI